MASDPQLAAPRESSERATILRALSAVVEPLAAALPGECEVVVHDLSALPNSIVAIGGGLTGRTPGGPATDMLLRAWAQGQLTTRLGYRSQHPDGRELRSSTVVVRDTADEPVAALCINMDTAHWRVVAEVARAMLPSTPSIDAAPGADVELFLPDVDALARQLLSSAIESVGVPVDLMQKRHKLTIVNDLQERGFFMLKESVETAAQALGVTRFTVYNYLNELAQESADEAEPGAG